jgi:hypothetical protein
MAAPGREVMARHRVAIRHPILRDSRPEVRGLDVTIDFAPVDV